MKKLLVTAGILGAAFAGWKLIQGWRDNTPSARQLKDGAKEASNAIKEAGAPSRNPVHSMG
jgi:hypothetical protein